MSMSATTVYLKTRMVRVTKAKPDAAIFWSRVASQAEPETVTTCGDAAISAGSPSVGPEH